MRQNYTTVHFCEHFFTKKVCVCVCVCVYVCVRLGFELGALCLLGKSSTT
jgi:hypothetical protein